MKTYEKIAAEPNLLIMAHAEDGGTGVIYRLGKPFASVIWSNGMGWEHVSMAPFKLSRTPTWDEMCKLKDMFFEDEEAVVQIHPPKSEYVNNMPNCLHRWRPITEKLPLPPSILVGIKGITIEEEKQ